MPPDTLGRTLLLAWTTAAIYGAYLFARGFRRNWRRYLPLRERAAQIHPGRLVLARSRLRRDAVYFGICLVALAIAVVSVLGPRGLIGPTIGVALTLIMVAVVVEGWFSQREDRLVERWNAPRDGRA